MPGLDAAIFQVLTLALLAATLLTAVAILRALGGIKKSLGDAQAARAVETAQAGPERAGQAPPAGEWLTGVAEESAQRPQPAPAETSRTEIEEAASTRSAHAPSIQTPSTHAQGVEGQASTPAGEEHTAAVGTGTASTGGADMGAHPLDEVGTRPAERTELRGWDEEPEDQPFERDGRWWYKRGDELLVYDEDAGEWQPAPAMAMRAAMGGSAIPDWDPGSPTGTEGASTAEAIATQVQTDEDLRAWRCPSCGAINGSTSTSCRMCFTARA